MKINTFFLVLVLTALNVNLLSQQDTSKISDAEKVRRESGVDPTRVASRFNFGLEMFDPEGDPFIFNNNLKLTLGVNRWSMVIETKITGNYSGTGNVQTGLNDISLSVLNAFFVSRIHSLAASFKFTFPTGSSNVSGQSFTITPSVVYAYTISQSMIIALQPQYTYTLWKNKSFPKQSLFTGRPFFAYFNAKGWFFVLEPRTLIDFELKKFDIIVAPILGFSLGGGFNLNAAMEIPIKKETRKNSGLVYKTGLQKNF